MEVSAVKLRNSYQIYFIDTNDFFLKQNTDCIVEIEHGIDIGKVVKIKSGRVGRECYIECVFCTGV